MSINLICTGYPSPMYPRFVTIDRYTMARGWLNTTQPGSGVTRRCVDITVAHIMISFILLSYLSIKSGGCHVPFGEVSTLLHKYGCRHKLSQLAYNGDVLLSVTLCQVVTLQSDICDVAVTFLGALTLPVTRTNVSKTDGRPIMM